MLFRILESVVPPVARAIWRPIVVGRDNVPSSGGVLLASNHLSFADSVVIPVVRAAQGGLPGQVRLLHRAPGSRARSSAAGSRGSACCRSTATTPRPRSPASSTALEVLGRGEAFGIYPEGTRSRDGRLYRGRTGVAHLALTAGVPVVPVGLQGTEKLQPVGSRCPSWPR